MRNGSSERLAVYAVVVTHQPKHEFFALIDALAPQVASVVVVDNASHFDFAKLVAAKPDVHLIRRSANGGLGAALNEGADCALANGASHLVFLDQDSIPGAGMVSALLACLSEKQTAGVSVAAVGPAWHDARMPATLSLQGVGRGASRSASEVPFLITSGMLIPREAFQSIGAFEGGLFIDSTDLEWCFRARAKGYRLFKASDAHLSHELGDAVCTVPGLPFLSYVRHRPERLYYITRNRILLYRRGYVPLSWKVVDICRAVLKFALASMIVPPRGCNAMYMLRGARDGVRGKTGPLTS